MIFSPQETLALSKRGPPSDVDKVRKNLKPGVYDVRMLVQVDGDIEIGLPEKTTEKFDAAKYLVAALSRLPKEDRAKVLNRPVVRKGLAAVVEMEIDTVKAKRPKKLGLAKIVPHLTVTRVIAKLPGPTRCAWLGQYTT